MTDFFFVCELLTKLMPATDCHHKINLNDKRRCWCCHWLRRLPGKHVARCSMRVSWVTVFRAEFMAEMARHRISPSGMNWDWLMGDILIGDTSPAGGQRSKVNLRVSKVKCYSSVFRSVRQMLWLGKGRTDTDLQPSCVSSHVLSVDFHCVGNTNKMLIYCQKKNTDGVIMAIFTYRSIYLILKACYRKKHSQIFHQFI